MSFCDASNWHVVDFSYYAVPQTRVRCIYTQNFDLPPPDARQTTLASCGFKGVVGSVYDIRAKSAGRALQEPATTVFSGGRPYLIYDDGTRRKLSPDQAARLQGFPTPITQHRDIAPPYMLRRMVDDAVPPPVARRLVGAALGVVKPADLVVDLFCGGGGFGVGARMAGAKNILAVDRLPRRLQLYRRLTGADSDPNVAVTTVCADLLLPSTWAMLHGHVQQKLSAGGRLHVHASPPCVSVSMANPKRKERQPEGLQFLEHVAAFMACYPDATASAEQAPRLLVTFNDFFR